jgi:hypothetical protein
MIDYSQPMKKPSSSTGSFWVSSSPASSEANRVDGQWALSTDARTGVWHYFPAGEFRISLCGKWSELRVPWRGPGLPDPDGLVGVCRECVIRKAAQVLATRTYAPDALDEYW